MPYEKLYWDNIHARVVRLNSSIQESESMSFLRLVFSLTTGVESNEADEYITDGTNDIGADAIYLDIDDEERTFNLYVIQTKYNKDVCERNIFNQNMGEEAINKFKNIFDFFSSNHTFEEVNDGVSAKKEEYDTLISDGYLLNNIKFISANLGIGPAENTKAILNRWLSSHPYRDKISYNHFGIKELFNKIEELETANVSDTINLYGRYFEYSTPDVKGIISTITASELIRLYDSFGDKMLQQNVRFYLGENTINKKIIKSASDTATRDKFWFFNNGITMICEDYERTGLSTENISLRVKNFQIVNGTQTTRAIKEAFRNTGNLDDVKILLKVYKSTANLGEVIAETTNNQNPVNRRDLRSNDEIQRLLERIISDKNYYYQRKRNQFIDKPKEKVIDNLLLAQLLHSFFNQKPHEARNQKYKLFGDDAVYSQLFGDGKINAEKAIFLHRLYAKLLKYIRTLSSQDIGITKDILIRSKLFLLYAIRIYFEQIGKNIQDNSFYLDLSQVDSISEELIKKIICIINEEVINLANAQSLNRVKVFQREELVESIKNRLIAEFQQQ